MAESVFRGTLGFFAEIGIYDVVLPFLLVFTLVFAILEKTRIFGMEKGDKGETTKKNLNAMVAFVTSFFVVASAQLVAIINQTLAHTFLLMLLGILVLMLVGTLHTSDREFALTGGLQKFFIGLMVVGLFLIFLNALGWLQLIYEYLMQFWDSIAVSSIIMVIFVVGILWYVTKSPSTKADK